MEGHYQLFQGDCLEMMDELIKQGVKVDCIIWKYAFYRSFS